MVPKSFDATIISIGVLHSDQDITYVFNEKPLVVCRLGKNAKEILVHSSLPVHTNNMNYQMLPPVVQNMPFSYPDPSV